MELHPKDRVLDMRQAHDLVLLSPRSDSQAVGKAISPHQEGVVAGRFKRLWQSSKNVFTIMVNF